MWYLTPLIDLASQLEELQQQLTAAQKELVEVRTQAENTARRDAEQLLDQDVQASLVEQVGASALFIAGVLSSTFESYTGTN